jgi:hypothetical protein
VRKKTEFSPHIPAHVCCYAGFGIRKVESWADFLPLLGEISDEIELAKNSPISPGFMGIGNLLQMLQKLKMRIEHFPPILVVDV